MSTTRGRSVRYFRGWRLWLARELTYSDRAAVVVMVVFTTVLTVVGVATHGEVSYQSVVLPMFIASLWLGPKSLPWFIVYCLLGVCLMVATQASVNPRSVVRVAVTFAVGLLILITSFRRSRLGVSGPRSESMFVDLRDRIAKQGQLPRLPEGWQLEAETQSAGGTAFAGDFVVASGNPADSTADLVVVDVSGKGVEAGTRALMLSGAFGGLLTALPPHQFLPAANDFLLRQDWDEGFATAIHLHLDLDSGDFVLRKAGHPPAIWLQAGSGSWRVLDSDGPVLGLIPGAGFDAVRGTLGPGDALMLYTDGLVESTRRDIGSGIDRLAGLGQRLTQHGFDGGARRVMGSLNQSNDDRALLVVHRR